MAIPPKCIDLTIDHSSAQFRRTRSRIPFEQKQEIAKFREEHPRLTQGEIANIFGIDRTTVTKLLKRKEKYLDICQPEHEDEKRRRIENADCTELEDILYHWYSQGKSCDVNFTDAALQHKAIGLAQELNLKDFRATDHWLHEFKKRFKIELPKKKTPTKTMGSDASNKISGLYGSNQAIAFPMQSNFSSINRGTTARLPGINISSLSNLMNTPILQQFNMAPIMNPQPAFLFQVNQTASNILASEPVHLKRGKIPKNRPIAPKISQSTSFHPTDSNIDPSMMLSQPQTYPSNSRHGPKGIVSDNTVEMVTSPVQEDSSEQIISSSSGPIESVDKTEHPIKVEIDVDEQEVLNREIINMDKFREHQRLIEEANKQKKALLSKTLSERQRKAKAESYKLEHIQRELSKLDSLLTADVQVIRNKIDIASREFNDAQRRYERAEKEFIESKLDLHKKSELKEALTEHLYTIIHQNELRKSNKLAELMKELEMEANEEDIGLPELPPLTAFSSIISGNMLGMSTRLLGWQHRGESEQSKNLHNSHKDNVNNYVPNVTLSGSANNQSESPTNLDNLIIIEPTHDTPKPSESPTVHLIEDDSSRSNQANLDVQDMKDTSRQEELSCNPSPSADSQQSQDEKRYEQTQNEQFSTQEQISSVLQEVQKSNELPRTWTFDGNIVVKEEP
ncbi:hypothetical protein CHS0354_026719 [Potamilus streckersoni]|uniref:RAB6-interacting golgin n=1 Tax=Potamilus streckersoni TaxID=2493646 RepID=A0AAE0S8D4_9BIVA|nr:hypothetical protein CHS0354_026719 [Potamilus streckersoni]